VRKFGRAAIITKSKVDPSIFDPELLAIVSRFISPEQVLAYLHELDELFLLVANAKPTDSSVECEAHKIVSQAGQLGLTRMSECARQVENAYRFGTGRAAAMRQCRAAVDDIKRYAMPAAGIPVG
jgi:hypothetical protein